MINFWLNVINTILIFIILFGGFCAILAIGWRIDKKLYGKDIDKILNENIEGDQKPSSFYIRLTKSKPLNFF